MTATAERAWRPNGQPQERFLAFGGFECLYGGAAGGGKSESLLIDALYGIDHESYRAVLFRRTFPELKQSLIDRSQDLYPHLGGRYHKTDHVWTFPNGAQVLFASIKDDGDERRFDSAELQFAGFDELTHFTRGQYTFLISRLRSSRGLRPRIRGATNPGGPGHEWVFRRWRPWLDPTTEYDGPRASSGQVLYIAPGEDTDPDGIVVPRGTPESLTRTFIRSTAYDNPALDPQYIAQLKTLDRVTRAQKLGGDWLAKPGRGEYFQRDWWRYLDEAPPRSVWRKAVRSWDLAGSESDDADWTVGVLYAHVPTLLTPWVIVDVVRIRGTPGKVRKLVKDTAIADGKAVEILLPQDPGQAGKDQADAYVADLAGFTVHTRRPTGDKITRASPHSTQVEHHQVALVRAAWNHVLVEEHQDLPEGEHDDIVDAAADGFTELAGGGTTASPEAAQKLQKRARAAGLLTPR